MPAGGTPGDPARTAVQWVELDRSGGFVQGGRIGDTGANATNGGRWYAYPSISVNAREDVLVGFSAFRSTAFAAAGYAFRFGSDPLNTMRDPATLKAGEGNYFKTFSGTRNRWGDYSMTQVDPLDDKAEPFQFSVPHREPFRVCEGRIYSSFREPRYARVRHCRGFGHHWVITVNAHEGQRAATWYN